MPYSTVSTAGFPGLDLLSAPDESGCVDLLNVHSPERGVVKTREGFVDITANGASASRYTRLQALYTTGGIRQWLGSRSGNIEAREPDGDLIGTHTGGSGEAYFARAGTTAEYVYAGNTDGEIARYEATGAAAGNWTTGAAIATLDGVGSRAMPHGGPMAVSPVDNRLMVNSPDSAGGPNGITSSQSHVWFSDAGDAQAWQTNNFEQLTPRDGEQIVWIQTWRDFVFVFKQSKFFVFYGTSVDSGGNPVFNYRPVDTGVGISFTRGNGTPCVAGRDGVYFANNRGIWRTAGGAPDLVTRDLGPLFANSVNAFFADGAGVDQDSNRDCSLAWYDDRLFFSYRKHSGGSNTRVLVWDADRDWWSVWNLPVNSFMPYKRGVDGQSDLWFSRSDAYEVSKYGVGATTDDGTAIVSRYRTGFSNLGDDDEKSIAQAELWGTGTVNYQLSKDFGSLDTATSVAMGTSPALARGRRVQRGGEPATLFSWQVGASSGAWVLHRAAHRVHANKPPAARTP